MNIAVYSLLGIVIAAIIGSRYLIQWWLDRRNQDDTMYHSPLECPEHNKTIACLCFDDDTKMYVSYLCFTTDDTMYSQWNEFVVKYKVEKWWYYAKK